MGEETYLPIHPPPLNPLRSSLDWPYPCLPHCISSEKCVYEFGGAGSGQGTGTETTETDFKQPKTFHMKEEGVDFI